MKKLRLALALAIVAIFVVVTPVLAAYYAYIYVEESDGNSYESLPASVACNTTILIQDDFMTSTALDTRVLTGSGEALPHMVANDKVMFVTGLAAYEKKTLIFYLGATSLSSFPIIVGYNGSFETPDDPDLEPGYIMELLIDGYFNAETEDIGHNILYKEDAFRVWISAANTLRVAALNSTGDEQWHLEDVSFPTGQHTVYIVCDGLGAKLYVDEFVTAVDTEYLFSADVSTLVNVRYDFGGWVSSKASFRRTIVYAHDMYWDFYGKADNNLYWKTSTDGMSWSSEYSKAGAVNDTVKMIDVSRRGDYLHVIYKGLPNDVRYRRGLLCANSTITWSDVWQTVASGAGDRPLEEISVGANGDDYPFVLWQDFRAAGGPGNYRVYVTKSSTTNGTWSTAGGYPLELYSVYIANPNNFFGVSLVSFYSSNEMYALWKTANGVSGRYYNGASWSGSTDLIGTICTVFSCYGVSDDDNNLYITWLDATNWVVYLRIRYADSTWSPPITIAVDPSDNDLSNAGISYNDASDNIYITYFMDNYFRCAVISPEWELVDYPIIPYVADGYFLRLTTLAYGDHIGFMYVPSYASGSNTYHGYVSFPWIPNDNNNDWYWMQNNVMPYADDIQMAVDGVLQLEYKPDSIIQGTALPDEENDHDATINWGANPAGVNTSMSALQFEQSYNETYYYQYLSPGSTDIIKPEPEGMGGDVDLDRLHDNPLYPLVQVLSIAGFLNERLVWLALAWFMVIVAMFLVHLGPDTHRESEKPQHFILTTIAGLGLSIMFYTMGIFPLWVIILMAFGLVGAIIWERQPVI